MNNKSTMVTEAQPKESTMAVVQDAAMSLCALGRPSSASPELADTVKSCSDEPSSAAAPAPADGSTSNPAPSSTNPTPMNLELDDRLQISDSNPPSASTSKAVTGKKAAPKKARPSATPKHYVKPKDPKRDTSVPFDEMKRLMRVYGSLKCLRNRTPVVSGKTAKVDSIKRKFYRWFPDLEERFVRTEEGWYRPKMGHEEEMRYREAARKGDQENLVKKRNSKRSSAKRATPAAAV